MTDEPLSRVAYPLFWQSFYQGDEVPNQWLQRYYSYYRRAIRDALSHANRKPFQQWHKSAPLNSTLAQLCRKWDSMATKWLPAILHCYDIPGLPRNNLKLEARFGQLRQHQRRVSGRKETTPLRRLAPGQLLCPTLDESELLSYLQSVPTDDYWRERRKQEALEEPQRWLWRLHRHPLKALAQIDTQFSAFLATKAEQRQALDPDL